MRRQQYERRRVQARAAMRLYNWALKVDRPDGLADSGLGDLFMLELRWLL